MISLKRKDSQNEIDKAKQTYRWEPKTNSRVRNRQVWSSYFGSEPTVNDINLQMQFSAKGSRDQGSIYWSRHRTNIIDTLLETVFCVSATTSLDKTKWGLLPHWYWRQVWVRDKKKKNVYYCKGCFVIIRDTGQVRSQDARKNIEMGIRNALDKGIIFGKTKYTLDDTVFDTVTEESAYWSGFLMSDGNINYGKTGNARIALVLAKVDFSHLEKFRDFLKCTNPIGQKKKKYCRCICYVCVCYPILSAIYFKTYCRNTDCTWHNPKKESRCPSDRIRK